MAPDQVTLANSEHLQENLYIRKEKRTKKPTLKVGDRGRLNMEFRLFKKGYLLGWTEEVFVARERTSS